jgi:hypothetical protein
MITPRANSLRAKRICLIIMAAWPLTNDENIPCAEVKVRVTKPVSVAGYGNVQRIKRR